MIIRNDKKEHYDSLYIKMAYASSVPGSQNYNTQAPFATEKVKSEAFKEGGILTMGVLFLGRRRLRGSSYDHFGRLGLVDDPFNDNG